MSVRHVHAKPDEYIAVHRDGSYSGGSRSSGDDSGIFGCLLMIAIGFVIYAVFVIVGAIVTFVMNYWHILLGGIVFALILWFWGKSIAKFLWNGVLRLVKSFTSRKTAGQQNSVRGSSPALQIENPQEPVYHPRGKIIQKRRNRI